MTTPPAIKDAEISIPNYRLFSASAISAATFIGGPVAGGLLLGLNFGRLGNPRARNLTFMLTAMGTYLMFLALIELPPDITNSIPNAVLPALYTPVFYMFATQLQGRAFEEHLAKGGLKGSVLGILLIIVVSLVLTLGPLFIWAINEPPFEFEGDVYKQGSAQNEVYHNEGVDPATMEKLGDYLLEWGYFDANEASVVQIYKTESGYSVYLGFLKSYWDDEELRISLTGLKEELGDILQQPVKVIMVDEDFNGVYQQEL